MYNLGGRGQGSDWGRYIAGVSRAPWGQVSGRRDRGGGHRLIQILVVVAELVGRAAARQPGAALLHGQVPGAARSVATVRVVAGSGSGGVLIEGGGGRG